MFIFPKSANWDPSPEFLEAMRKLFFHSFAGFKSEAIYSHDSSHVEIEPVNISQSG